MTEPIRIVLADDHPVVRAGLRAILATAPDLALVGEAADGDAARRLCAATCPDVLLLDLRMPGSPATETIPWLRDRCPATRVVMLTAHREDAWVRVLLDLGAAGYILKDDALEAVPQSMRAVAAGGSWFSSAILPALARSKHEAESVALTPREREVLALVAAGRSTREIAVTLNLGAQTVSNYLSTLYSKLGVPNRAAAAVWARDHDLR